MNVPVTWTASPKYDSGTADKYIFTPKLPEGCTLMEGVSGPEITVTVEASQGRAALTGQMQPLTAGDSIDITGKDVYAIQSEITGALSEDDIVTVTGSKTSVIGTLQLILPEGKTVEWQAEYAGDISRLISINGGGYFVVGGDAAITNTGAGGTAIYAEYTSPAVAISGGTITASGENGTAVQADDESFTVTVSGGTVSASGTGGAAIQAYGESSMITVSGGEVSADGESGTAIFACGDVEVSGTAEVSANNSEGWAIDVDGENSTVTVSGGTVSAGGEYGCAIYADGKSSTITVSGAAEVSADGKFQVSANPDGGTIYAAGNVIIEDNAMVEATGAGGRTIYAYGDVEVSGGTVSATWCAIYAKGENSTVTVSGGTVSAYEAVFTGDIGSTIIVSGDAVITSDGPYAKAICANGDIEMSGGTVSADDSYGVAISTLGNVTVSSGAVTGGFCAITAYGAIEVSGGRVGASGEYGYAIYADGASPMVTVSGGAVFGCGDGINHVIYTTNSSGFTSATGTGVVIAWKQSAGRTTYDEGLPTHLILSSTGDTATAVWDVQGDEPGIAYQNGTNEGFIPVGAVTVTALSATINGSEVSFDNSEKTAAIGVPNSVSSIGTSDVSVTVSGGTTWRLYSDSACKQEAVLPYNLNVGANILYLKIDDGNGHSQVYTVTVTRGAVPVSGISVAGGNAISVRGGTLQLTADVTPENAANKGVTWSIVSGGAYAAISSSGLVTAIADGAATVRATAQDGSGVLGEKQITVSGQGGDVSDGDTPDYTRRTLTDSATGVTVSGNMSEGTVLMVGDMTLGTDAASNTIHQRMSDRDYMFLLGVDISLSDSFTGPLTISLPVGAQYNGQTVTILHAKRDGTLETYTAIVRDGKATFTVISLSPFAVFAQAPATPTPTPTPTPTIMPTATPTAMPAATPTPPSDGDELDDIPRTGDSSSPWVWWLLCGVSAMGIAALVKLSKRKKMYKR
jgi:hypothetical protein